MNDNYPRLLKKKQAMEYLGIKVKKDFDELINNGEIGFVKYGKTPKFTIEELERWRNTLKHRTDYTLEVKPGMPISRSKLKMEKEYSLEKLRQQMILNKHSPIASKELANSNKRLQSKKVI